MTVDVNDVTRGIIQIEEDDSVGNSLFVACYEDHLCVEIHNPWSGSTETGFGATAYISLSGNDAFILGEWLLKTAAKKSRRA